MREPQPLAAGGRGPRSRTGRTADRLHRRVARVSLGHAALARAGVLSDLCDPVDRRVARLDRRVHEPGAEALRRHADPDLGVLRARLRQRVRPACDPADEPDPRRLRRSRTTTSSTCSRRWCSNRFAGTHASAGVRCSRSSGRRRSSSGARSASGWESATSRRRYADFERFNLEFERERFGYTDAGHRVAAATRDMFLDWFPGLPKRVGRPLVYALLDEPLARRARLPTRAPDASSRGGGGSASTVARGRRAARSLASAAADAPSATGATRTASRWRRSGRFRPIRSVNEVY